MGLKTEDQVKVLFIPPRELYIKYYILKYKEQLKKKSSNT